ncbi:hypothetical protein D3C85_1797810 [compost metagenome]
MTRAIRPEARLKIRAKTSTGAASWTPSMKLSLRVRTASAAKSGAIIGLAGEMAS